MIVKKKKKIFLHTKYLQRKKSKYRTQVFPFEIRYSLAHCQVHSLKNFG